MNLIKKTAKISFLALIACIMLIIISFKTIEYSAKNRIFDNVDKIPSNRVGLLLGTGKYLKSGYINLYYKYRIEAAVKLYKANKIDFVLISGDNSRKTYDEPSTMKQDLIDAGIPEEKIFLDYAGFRTLDSVVRAKHIFGQKSITIISQEFHNKRALFIAKNNQIDAVAFNCQNVSSRYGFKVTVREYFARVKAIIDYVIGLDPKFYGDPIQIK